MCLFAVSVRQYPGGGLEATETAPWLAIHKDAVKEQRGNNEEAEEIVITITSATRAWFAGIVRMDIQELQPTLFLDVLGISIVIFMTIVITPLI